ncbi:hypothetical protein C7M61_005257 [Candidozyma pseudohaemuli]|uniref:37S ribosomal protein S25, mitochondrial n=1 Tax=Candidozyma pseudohaemuli TaxID=418784 RepID=A0A2P7YCL1_9ASCO|nr:hypothetical protein C7M61_005257 [[Candida] pseudohaemulonii]PSK33704.1 hypothetical protein C7M61_005257 [[Candida] pseudohaemulonii]
MKIQHDASRVLERTSHFLRKGVITDRPAWVPAVGLHPTGYDLTKRPKRFDAGRQPSDPQNDLYKKQGQFYNTRTSPRERRNTHASVNAVPKIKLLEDQLRDVFYHQHPWELARPKNTVENDGQDIAKCDWSHMLQVHKPLDGELVVQRTLHLLKQQPKTKNSLFEAYDQARFEFYQLRMADEMSLTVLREELAMFGAVYPISNMEWGTKKEQEAVDVWTQQAAEQTRAREATRDGSKAVAATEGDSLGSIWESTVVEEVEE